MLKEALESDGGELLERLLFICFDYEKAFNVGQQTIKKIDEEGIWGDRSPLDTYDTFFKLVNDQKLTPKILTAFARDCREEDWKLYKRILSKDLKCGLGFTSVKKLVPSLRKFESMAANKNLSKLDFYNKQYIVEPKLDGVRCIAFVEGNSVKLWTRNGRLLTNFTKIEEQLLYMYGGSNVAIDGELLCEKNQFSRLMSNLFRINTNDEMLKTITYNTFDILPLIDFREQNSSIPLATRKRALKTPPKNCDLIQKVEFKAVSSMEEIQELFANYVEEGYEGVMIKDCKAPYKWKRTDDWIKLKPTDDYTICITSCNEGTGKYEGQLGSFNGYYIEDPSITANVGSGLTDDMRVEFWSRKEEFIGAKIDIISDKITDTKSFRFPIFKRLRPDL